MARLSRIGLNLLVLIPVLCVLAAAAYGIGTGEMPKPAMFGVDIQTGSSAEPEHPGPCELESPGGTPVVTRIPLY